MQWIGGTKTVMNQLRREFTVPWGGVREAWLYSSGIGYHEVFVNGKSVDPTRRVWLYCDRRCCARATELTDISP
jgi:hypothetical protein